MAEKIYNVSFVNHDGRDIRRVPTELCLADKLGSVRARWGFGRMDYAVEPGLYAVGNPDSDSHVFASANYKLSFDSLRKELVGLDGWIIVLDTKGINVWCAAGKGTFGTEEMVQRVGAVGLDKIVNHRKIIAPQLGAVGVAAHEVRKQCGFSVIYGPVRACDIKAFLEAGKKATEQMRQVHFSFYDRLVLTPMELVGNVKSLLFIVAAFFVLSGFKAWGYDSDLVITAGVRSTTNLLAAYIGGAVIGPLLLPWLPGRSFSFKGFIAGLLVFLVLVLTGLTGGWVESIGWVLMVAAAASFITMNFTGSSTYTSLSGVKKEIRVAAPLQLAAAVVGVVMWLISRFI